PGGGLGRRGRGARSRGVVLIEAREVRAHPGRNLLTLIGIGLGVARVVAVSLASRSSTGAFAEMVDALAGEAVLEVSGGEVGFGGEVLDIVRGVSGVKRGAALILGNVYLDHGP